MFRAIASDNFPPFGKLFLELAPVQDKPSDLAEVHLFTGVNGTGKTRLLAILGAVLGSPSSLVKRTKGIEGNIYLRVTDVFPTPANRDQWPFMLVQGTNAGWQTGVQMVNWCQTVPAFAYSGTAYVTDVPIAVMADVPKPVRESCLSFNRLEDHSKMLLQAITNLKLQAAMDSMNEGPEEAGMTRATRIVRALESTITKITGFKFLFQVTTYPKTTLLVRWAGAELAFDLLPDGLRSLIGWLAHAVVMMDAWLQGKQNPMEAEAIFLLDEIESALHPAWQRKILPAFQALFPNSQIFVASHSPFLISSLNHGWIHSLKMGKDGKVIIEPAQPASEGDSYISVVEDIMGIKEWYDPETEELLDQFRHHRDAAYRGVSEARAEARKLAAQIGERSMELEDMMGRELRQMDRTLQKTELPQ